MRQRWIDVLNFSQSPSNRLYKKPKPHNNPSRAPSAPPLPISKAPGDSRFCTDALLPLTAPSAPSPSHHDPSLLQSSQMPNSTPRPRFVPLTGKQEASHDSRSLWAMVRQTPFTLPLLPSGICALPPPARSPAPTLASTAHLLVVSSGVLRV